MIRQASIKEIEQVTALALLLWPHHTFAELEAELKELIEDSDCAIFLKYDHENTVGFAQCQLRHDYVEGTSSSPVAYLEGIFVKETYRHQGYAKELLNACENWAKAMKCQEFASDCELTNQESLLFHKAMHFEEANRIICFTKKLKEK